MADWTGTAFMVFWTGADWIMRGRAYVAGITLLCLVCYVILPILVLGAGLTVSSIWRKRRLDCYISAELQKIHPDADLMVSVKRSDDKWLGLVLRDQVIVNISDTGLIAEWNRLNRAHAVQIGDRILCLIGEDGSKVMGTRKILQELRKNGPLHIAIQRRQTDANIEPPTPETTDRLMKDHWLPELSRVDTSRKIEDICPICLEDFCASSEVVQLPCNHMFHLGCVGQHFKRCVLASEATCPICRQKSFAEHNSPVFPCLLDRRCRFIKGTERQA